MPSIELPSNVGFGVVVGRFLQTVADGSDIDQNPEATPMQGSVFFTPSVPVLVNRTALPVPVTLGSTPIEAKIDFEGYLTDLVGRRGITLIATDDPDNNPTNWTYTVSFRLSTGTLPNFSIAVPMGQTIDLSTVLPVPASQGIGLPQAIAAAAAAEASAAQALAILESGGGGGGGGTGDHGDLVGLGDDDHTQYLNNTRGDARYYTKAQIDTTITNTSNADRNRSNHTGFQSADTLTDGITNRTYSTAEKNKLASLTPGTANSTDAQLRDRATHTGTQLSTTIADFTEAVQDVLGAAFSGGNVTATYNDTTGTIAITAPAGGTGVADPEAIRDTIGAAMLGVGPVTVTANDAADTITITLNASVTATASTVVQRDAAGRAQFVDPVVAADAATKGYIDTTARKIATRTFFPIRYVSNAWEYGSVAAAITAGMGPNDTIFFIGGPTPPTWGRDFDVFGEG